MTGLPSPTLDRRGGTFALFAVMLTGLLGSIAIAVDVGMGFNARSEAQRVADSAALAGASAFIDEVGLTAETEADARALAYATGNEVHGSTVLAGEVAIDSDWSTKEVEVTITRDDIPAWFARFLGVLDIDVFARAVAKVSDGGTANQCLLPLTPPDIWDDNDADTVVVNNLPDAGEEWDYTEPPDAYSPWDGTSLGSNGIGYGSNFRGGDEGTLLYLKAGAPGQTGKGGGPGGGDEPFGPGNFLGWRMPDPDQGCEGSGSGVPWMRWNINNCNTCPIGIGQEYEYDSEPGNMATILDDIAGLIGQDDGTSWDASCNGGEGCLVSTTYADPFDSPRVRPVAFFDPRLDLTGASVPLEFSNIAWIFIEGSGSNPDFTVWARFIGTVTGGEEGPGTGPLVQYLRLIE